MKKLLFLSMLLFSICTILFLSCSKEDDEKCCWKFTVKKVMSVSPNLSGFPKTTTSSSTQCDLTESEADVVASKMTNTTNVPGNGHTFTTKTTVTKKKTSDSDQPDGERVPTGRP